MKTELSSIFTRNCISCKPIDLAEAQRTLFTTKHCRVVLRIDDQAWLGRCIILPKRHIPSFDQMRPEEREDLYDCRAKVTKVYQSLFGMTYDNWLQLGNTTRDHDNKETIDLRYFHIHYHLIPRYTQPVHYAGRTFTDVQFGKPLNIDPASGHQKVVLSPEQLLQLKDDIQVELISQRLISKENLKNTNPSEKIVALFAKHHKPQSSWLLLGAAVLAVTAIIFGFRNIYASPR